MRRHRALREADGDDLDVSQVKKAYFDLVNSVAERIKILPDDLKKVFRSLYDSWLKTGAPMSKTLQMLSRAIDDMAEGYYDYGYTWKEEHVTPGYGYGIQTELKALKGAESMLDSIFDHVDMVSRGEPTNPDEAGAAMRFIKLVRDCPKSALGDVSGLLNTRLRTAFEDIHNADPEVKQESSVAFLQKAVSITIALRGLDEMLERLDEVEARLEAWSTATKVTESEAFKDFTRKVEEILRPIRELEVSQGEVGDIIDAITEGGGYVSGFRYAIASYIERGDLQKKMERAGGADPTYVMYKAFVQKDAVEDGWFLNKLSGAVKKAIGDMEDATAGVPPDAASGASDPPFGQYVFAPARRGEVPFEKNTPEESHAFDQLKKHVVDNTPMDDESSLTLMQAMEDDAYPRIIHEPSEQYVFRGISMEEAQLTRLLGENPEGPAGSKLVSKWVGSKGERQGSTGWSTDRAVAADFASSTSTKPYAVMLVARVKDNPDSFLEGPDGFYKVKPLGVYPSERETIALGPVKLYKVYWQDNAGRYREFDKSVVEESLLRRLVREALRG